MKKHLISALPNDTSKAFIITGKSLANKTDLVKQVEELLGAKHHAGTFADIGQVISPQRSNTSRAHSPSSTP
ncbi:hypothetical protein NL505_29990, partial [Klebsiella pneumoniae]|nr:hypothetical protein [Klebsiella pneumoniae]